MGWLRFFVCVILSEMKQNKNKQEQQQLASVFVYLIVAISKTQCIERVCIPIARIFLLFKAFAIMHIIFLNLIAIQAN